MARGRRLLRKDVQRRAPHLPFVQRPEERVLVDEAAAGAVDEERAALHPGEFGPPDQGAGILPQGNVKGQDVGLAEDLRPRAQLHSQPPGPLL